MNLNTQAPSPLLMKCQIDIFFFNDTATTEIYTSFPTRRSSDLAGLPLVQALDILAQQTENKILADTTRQVVRSEEHTSELQSRLHLVCRLLLEKKKKKKQSAKLQDRSRQSQTYRP